MVQISAKPATAATVNGLQIDDQLERQIDFLAKTHSFRMQGVPGFRAAAHHREVRP
jgi:hypothetical protein